MAHHHHSRVSPVENSGAIPFPHAATSLESQRNWAALKVQDSGVRLEGIEIQAEVRLHAPLTLRLDHHRPFEAWKNVVWFNQIRSAPFAIKSYELRDGKTFLGRLSARSAGRRFSLYSNYWMRKPKTEFG
jgi:hypothetical protein